MQVDQFILFGDSITQQSFSQNGPVEGSSPQTPGAGFFGPALTDAYVRKLDVINRGMSGYNTTQALKILPQAIPSPEHAGVRFLTIFFGANDARLPNTPSDPQQHVPLDKFKENLRAIATHQCVKPHKDVRIILITPPPVEERVNIKADEAKLPGLGPMFRRSVAETARYAQAVRALGWELNLPVLDIWGAMMKKARYNGSGLENEALVGSRDAPESKVLQEFLHDGLHFSRSAYVLLYKELMELIEQTWPDQMPDQLPFVLPRWDDEEVWQNENALEAQNRL
ncbi:hypothetical protein LTR37_015886 [Vermiconidia calcicola]|uniref:Uncharacterized protein n=1 Tax=Vermiconidia calcicola TaxID=1690605 RepID=A0ACC3MPE7_9PEZI|nr:hypothetical protein LTR37_015886 [Vermiconidia calcicola]